ncbi:MAG: hypothetical protein B6D59_00210 [Campylobacteraceae bacterium 4484_4]|nr:MAG: hypothetical protein B6D59_00210 [Campylobacteraceae bacterium 4484_4]
MALKILVLVLLLFVFEIAFLTTKEPKIFEELKQDINFTDISFDHIRAFSITPNGIEAQVTAAQVKKHTTFSELFDTDAYFINRNVLDHVRSDYTRFENNLFTFSDHVLFENNTSLKIRSHKITYDTQKRVATSHTPFILTSLEGNATGDNLFYDRMRGIIRADHVKFVISEREGIR